MDKEEPLARGDRVQLGGQGPVMHVLGTSRNLCYCNWVDAHGQLQQGTYEARQLRRVPPEEAKLKPPP